MPSSARDETDVDALREQVDTLTKQLQEYETRNAEQQVKIKRGCGSLGLKCFERACIDMEILVVVTMNTVVYHRNASV